MKQSAALERQQRAVDALGYRELQSKFTSLCGYAPGVMKTQGLRRRIVYRLQEIEFGGLSAEDKSKLEKIADGDMLANLIREGVARAILKGTRLSREWKGVRHEVIATGERKFEYNGKTYKSLSAIAREITGTRWNGKIFFGVKK